MSTCIGFVPMYVQVFVPVFYEYNPFGHDDVKKTSPTSISPSSSDTDSTSPSSIMCASTTSATTSDSPDLLASLSTCCTICLTTDSSGGGRRQGWAKINFCEVSYTACRRCYQRQTPTRQYDIVAPDGSGSIKLVHNHLRKRRRLSKTITKKKMKLSTPIM